MQVRNIHERVFQVRKAQVEALLDSLSSSDDRLWPRDRWPRMAFDRPLTAGAVGGHGPVRYSVQSYQPGREVVFGFSRPRGVFGTHRYVVDEVPEGVRLRHLVEIEARGLGRLSWPLVFGPLHDACLEDSLDAAERELTGTVRRPARWSRWVRALRWVFTRLPSLQRAPDPARAL